MSSTVSVIIPAYNAAQYLPACIESVLGQTHKHVEIIVVNDGSTDNTDEVVKPYLSRIKYIKQENRGLSAARNAGFRASNGAFICFLDADDLLMPEKFEKQLAKFQEEPDLGVVISGYHMVDADGITILSTVRKSWGRDALQRLLRHEVFPPHAALVRREVLERSSLFPENIDTGESQEDWQLWLDLALDGVQFGTVVEPTCLYRRNVPGSISTKLLKYNEGSRRVVRWLRNEPRAQRYAKQIERLAAMVDVQRIGRAWCVNEISVAIQTLEQSSCQYPRFWCVPATYRWLFEEASRYKIAVEGQNVWRPERVEETIVNGILEAVRNVVEPRTLCAMRSAAFLCAADVAYSRGDGVRARLYVRRALLESARPLLAGNALLILARSILGPKAGRVVGSLYRLSFGAR
jgi:glycosyltransferase involved in cell wall biosynthesis